MGGGELVCCCIRWMACSVGILLAGTGSIGAVLNGRSVMGNCGWMIVGAGCVGMGGDWNCGMVCPMCKVVRCIICGCIMGGCIVGGGIVGGCIVGGCTVGG